MTACLQAGDGHGFYELERVIAVGSKGHISELHAHTAGSDTCFTVGRVVDMLNDTSLGNSQHISSKVIQDLIYSPLVLVNSRGCRAVDQ